METGRFQRRVPRKFAHATQPHHWKRYSSNRDKKKSTTSAHTEEITTAVVVARPTPCVPPRTRNPQ
jgi:hypothetical protein